MATSIAEYLSLRVPLSLPSPFRLPKGRGSEKETRNLRPPKSRTTHAFLNQQNLFPPVRSPAARRTRGSKVSQANSDLPVGSREDRRELVERSVEHIPSSSSLRV